MEIATDNIHDTAVPSCHEASVRCSLRVPGLTPIRGDQLIKQRAEPEQIVK